MNKEEIVSVLSELHKISGLRVSLHGTDFEEIAAAPEEKLPFCKAIQKDGEEYIKCRECDEAACKRVKESGETLIYSCRYGLTEVISPLYNFGTLTGYLMMGQVASETTDKEKIKSALREKIGDAPLTDELADGISTVRSDMISSYVTIMTICAKYLTLTNVLPSNAPKNPELAKMYIHDHYAEKISIKDICKAIGCSKSALLTAFKAEYGTTVNSYICDVRIEKAKRLLKTTDLSMSEIAYETGFYDQSYFSKVFYSKLSITPSDYRREITKE